MTLQHLLLVLRARWRVLAAVVVLALVATAAVNIALPKLYRATSTVVVDVKGNDPVSGGNAQQNQVVPGYMSTQIGIVSSHRVVKRVIAATRLEDDEKLKRRWQKESGGQGDYNAWVAALLSSKLDVRPSHEGNLIDISVEWNDARRAAQLANAFAQAYIDTNLELKVEPAKQYTAWFEERTKVMRKNLEDAQARLSDFQRRKGIVATSDGRLDVENARLAELSSQLTVLQGLRADTASREKQTTGNRDNLPEVLQNPVIGTLKSELSKLEAKRADMTVRLGDNHPEMQRLDGEIGSVRERIRQETNRIAASLGTADRVNEQREAQIRAGLDAQRARVLELSKQHDEIAVLQNDVANAQRAYDTVTQRLAQTSLESQNQTTNVMIITPAVAPLFPTSPRMKVNMVLALVFGSLIGLALALFVERVDQRVHGEEHMRVALGIPVFAVLEPARRVSTRRGFHLGMTRRPALAHGS